MGSTGSPGQISWQKLKKLNLLHKLQFYMQGTTAVMAAFLLLPTNRVFQWASWGQWSVGHCVVSHKCLQYLPDQCALELLTV